MNMDRLRLICLVLVCIFSISYSYADVIYFKNGFRTEGEVKKSKEGIWVNGGLFREDEIERIEVPPPKQEEKKPWYSQWFGGKKEESAQAAPRPAVSSAPVQQAVVPANPIIQLIAPQPAAQPDALGQGASAYQGYMMNQKAVLEQAQQLQQQAIQRQMMMQQQIQMMEGGGSVEPSPREYQKYQPPSVPTVPSSVSRPSSSEYQEKPRTKNPLGKGIKFHEDGTASWE